MDNVVAKTSRMPIWAGVIGGAVIGLANGTSFIVAVTLGFVLGYVLYARNLAWSENARLNTRIGALLERVSLLEYSVKLLRSAPSVIATAPDLPRAVDVPIDSAPLEPPPAEVTRSAVPVETPVAPSPPPAYMPPIASSPGAASARAARARDAVPSFFDKAIGAAKAWLFGGNTVARVGLLVLFVGVAFLLRYVAERTQIPIELRLVGVALGALALLGIGWRLRHKRAGYAITLQGGAIGILYLTVFAALRLYDVLPAVPAFALLAALAVFSGVLAVAQNARALAALGAAGGFLAPILVSTGSGRIEVLLSFYLLLNLGVLGIAWFRAWRELNWIGFAFTFGVLGTWVAQRYSAAQYPVAQGFLIAFWLLFLLVSLLYALRQSHERRGIFDTTLMFALPLAAFGIQSRLTEGVQLALAATVAAAAYLISSALLMKRRDGSLRVLVEANFGVGVALLTLAVPLAASAQWTAAAWALEGLALLWVGTRQQRVLPTLAGLALHIAGAVALLRALDTGAISTLPQFSGFTLNLAVFAATAFASAVVLARGAIEPAAWGRSGALIAGLAPRAMRLIGWAWVVLLVWQPLPYPWYVVAWCAVSLALMVANRRHGDGALSPEWIAGVAIIVLAWLTTEARAGAIVEFASQLSVTTLLRLAVTVTAVSAALLSLAGGAKQRAAAAALLALGVFVWLFALFAETWARIDSQWAAAQIALAIVALTAAVLVWLAHRIKWGWPLKLSWVHFVAHIVLATAAVVIAIEAAQMPSRHYGWLVWPLAWMFFYVRLAWEERAPVRAPASVQSALHVGGLWLLTAMTAAEAALRIDTIAGDGWFHGVWGAVPAIALWLVVQYAVKWPMRAAPFAYVSVGASGLAMFSLAWIVFISVLTPGDPAPLGYLPLLNPLDLASLLALGAVLRWHLADQRVAWQRAVRYALGTVGFIALNAAALRAVHFLGAVPWNFDALSESLLVQSVLSLLWTATAMGLMVLAHRRTMRGWWVVGAALLAAVVVKLFFVDLSGQGTVYRIVSFVGVGVLILLIGYLAPVPPSAPQPTRSAA
ncbi:MAG TPA: DUF2339 domain-containing protein [Burkholderiaceae bacterium]|nr:DUF2339 domain-containing protein [Burkholderiaceae bacterium]